jgi:hypothetical protein
LLHSTPEDPSRLQFVQKLMVLNEEFASALDDLTRCELAIIESMGDDEMPQTTSRKVIRRKKNEQGKGLKKIDSIGERD